VTELDVAGALLGLLVLGKAFPATLTRGTAWEASEGQRTWATRGVTDLGLRYLKTATYLIMQ
jgi:hypothetical protein